MKKIVFLLLIVFFTPFQAKTQTDSPETKNSFGIEVLGKSPVFGNIFYERYFFKRFSAGICLGFAEYNKLYTKPQSRIAFSNSIYAAYQFRKRDQAKKWHKNIGSGFIFLQEATLNNESKEVINYSGEGYGFISFSFEYRPKRNYFRIDPYVLIGDDFFITSGILPWIGFSFGRRF